MKCIVRDHVSQFLISLIAALLSESQREGRSCVARRPGLIKWPALVPTSMLVDNEPSVLLLPYPNLCTFSLSRNN